MQLSSLSFELQDYSKEQTGMTRQAHAKLIPFIPPVPNPQTISKEHFCSARPKSESAEWRFGRLLRLFLSSQSISLPSNTSAMLLLLPGAEQNPSSPASASHQLLCCPGVAFTSPQWGFAARAGFHQARSRPDWQGMCEIPDSPELQQLRR